MIDAQYSTSIDILYREAFDDTMMSWSRGVSSSTPTSDALDVTGIVYPDLPDWLHLEISAAASAGTLSVSTETLHATADYGHAWATAETTLTFRTLQDTTSSIELAFLHLGIPYSAGFVSLTDLTTEQSKFRYSWDCCGLSNSTVPWQFGPTGRTALLSPLEWFDASHLYQLTLHAASYASQDGQYVHIGVSGLTPVAAPVPEPETWAMALAGIAAAGAMARRRRPCTATRARTP